MPKITVHEGPTNAAAEVEEGEQSSPGMSSSTSQPKQQPSETMKPEEDQSPAPTTENPSEKGQTEGSTARLTGGDPKTEDSPKPKSGKRSTAK